MRKLEFSLASAHKRYYRTERSGDGVAWNSVPYNMIVEQVMDLLLSFLHKENSDSESRHAKNNPTGHMLNIPRMIFFRITQSSCKQAILQEALLARIKPVHVPACL
jgi:hypothetical protein